MPVGVQVQNISPVVCAQIAEYATAGGLVFVDSGAFGAFIKGHSVDFDKVLERYTLLAGMTSNPGNLAVVAPDVIGDMQLTADLQIHHLDQIATLALLGVEIMVPFQRGWTITAYVEHYRVLEMAIGPFTLAFACNKAAWSPADVAKLVSTLRPARVHLLGVGTKNLGAYSDAVLWNSPETGLSSDANRTRVFLGAGRPITEATRKGVEAISKEAESDFDSCYDATELDFDLHNSPGYFEVAEAKALARIFGVTSPRELDKWGKWSQEEADENFQLKNEERHNGTYGCKLGYLIESADPNGYYTQAAVHSHGGSSIKEIVAKMIVKHQQKNVRRKAIATTLLQDGNRRQLAYSVRTSQMVLFQAAA